MSVSKIAAEDVNERLNSGEKVMFVDTRPREIYTSDEAKLPGAIHVPVDEAEKHIRDVNRNRLVVTYGEGDDEGISTQVAELLEQHGFKDVHPLAGGMKAWREVGLPVEHR